MVRHFVTLSLMLALCRITGAFEWLSEMNYTHEGMQH